MRQNAFYIFYVLFLSSVFIRGQELYFTIVLPNSYTHAAVEVSKLIEGVIPEEELWLQDTLVHKNRLDFKIVSPDTGRCIVRVNQFAATLHVMPAGHYTIQWPQPDSLNFYSEQTQHPVFPELIENAPTRLNFLIRDYQLLVNTKLDHTQEGYKNRRTIIQQIDTLWRECIKRYQHIKDPYFTLFWNYQTAQLQWALSYQTKSLYSNFIGRPALAYKHPAVLEFLSNFYGDYIIQRATAQSSTSIYRLVNESPNLQSLNEIAAQDPLLQNDTLRQWVYMNTLWHWSFDARFNRSAVFELLKQLQSQSLNRELQRQCEIVLSYFKTLQPGDPAPDFTVYNHKKQALSLSNYKGRWVYLSFLDANSRHGMMEQEVLKKWQHTYGSKIQFLSVLLNSNALNLTQLCSEQSDIQWPITYISKGNGLASPELLYQIYSNETYVLVDPLGRIYRYPAPAPTEGIEQVWKTLLKPAHKTRKIGIR